MQASNLGFREDPFTDLPDPRFTFRYQAFQSVCADLLYARMSDRQGVTVISGAEGIGKTTLLELLLHERASADRYHIIAAHRKLTFEKLLQQSIEALGLVGGDQAEQTEIDEAIDFLTDYVLETSQAGGRVIFLVDRAESLSADTLDGLVELTRLGHGDGRLLQVILAVRTKAGSRALPEIYSALGAGLAFHFHLMPLMPEEVEPYVRHRLDQVGYEGADLFTGDAFADLSDLITGHPLRINRIVTTAFQILQAEDLKAIDGATISDAAERAGLFKPPPRDPPAPDSASDEELESTQAPSDPPTSKAASAEIFQWPHGAKEDENVSLEDEIEKVRSRGAKEDDWDIEFDPESLIAAEAKPEERRPDEGPREATQLDTQRQEELERWEAARQDNKKRRGRGFGRGNSGQSVWRSRVLILILMAGIGWVVFKVGGKEETTIVEIASPTVESEAGLESAIPQSSQEVSALEQAPPTIEISPIDDTNLDASELEESSVSVETVVDPLAERLDALDDKLALLVARMEQLSGSASNLESETVEPEPLQPTTQPTLDTVPELESTAEALADGADSASLNEPTDPVADLDAISDQTLVPESEALESEVLESEVFESEALEDTEISETGTSTALPSAGDAPALSEVERLRQEMAALANQLAALQEARGELQSEINESSPSPSENESGVAAEDTTAAEELEVPDDTLASLSPPAIPAKPKNIVSDLQDKLKNLGYSIGATDGRLGGRTVRAIEKYQRDHGLLTDGTPSQELANHVTAFSLLKQAVRQYNSKDYKAALGSYDSVLSLQPEDPETKVLRGISALRTGAVDLAIDDLSLSLTGEARDQAIAYFRPGRVYYIQNRLKELGFDPGRTDGLMIRQTEDAIVAYERRYDLPVSGQPSVQLLRDLEIKAQHNMAIAAYQRGEHLEALDRYHLVQSLSPEDAEVYFNRGLTYKVLGLTEDALNDYAIAATLDPKLSKVYYDRGNIRWDQGRYREAISDYWQAVVSWL